ncbi:hypothetical protein ACFLYY_02580 [Patescibacteria group bacterium]
MQFRTIYLYLFTIIGLVLLVIGTVRLIDMGLKAFIFTQAEAPERLMQKFSCQNMFVRVPSIEKLETNQVSSDFTTEEQTMIKAFLEDYKRCQEEGDNIDYLSSQRQRDASSSLAMILVGLPLYLYHWRTIKRETKK